MALVAASLLGAWLDSIKPRILMLAFVYTNDERKAQWLRAQVLHRIDEHVASGRFWDELQSGNAGDVQRYFKDLIVQWMKELTEILEPKNNPEPMFAYSDESERCLRRNEMPFAVPSIGVKLWRKAE